MWDTQGNRIKIVLYSLPIINNKGQLVGNSVWSVYSLIEAVHKCSIKANEIRLDDGRNSINKVSGLCGSYITPSNDEKGRDKGDRPLINKTKRQIKD